MIWINVYLKFTLIQISCRRARFPRARRGESRFQTVQASARRRFCFAEWRGADFAAIAITATGYETRNLPEFAPGGRPGTFSLGAALPLSATHQAVDLMEASPSEVLRLSMVFDRRRRRAEKRAIDSRKTSEKRRFHEVDGAPRLAGAGSGRAAQKGHP